jgi:hypothetical protein
LSLDFVETFLRSLIENEGHKIIKKRRLVEIKMYRAIKIGWGGIEADKHRIGLKVSDYNDFFYVAYRTH